MVNFSFIVRFNLARAIAAGFCFIGTILFISSYNTAAWFKCENNANVKFTLGLTKYCNVKTDSCFTADLPRELVRARDLNISAMTFSILTSIFFVFSTIVTVNWFFELPIYLISLIPMIIGISCTSVADVFQYARRYALISIQLTECSNSHGYFLNTFGWVMALIACFIYVLTLDSVGRVIPFFSNANATVARDSMTRKDNQYKERERTTKKSKVEQETPNPAFAMNMEPEKKPEAIQQNQQTVEVASNPFDMSEEEMIAASHY